MKPANPDYRLIPNPHLQGYLIWLSVTYKLQLTLPLLDVGKGTGFLKKGGGEACGEQDHLLEVEEIPKAGEHLL